MKAFTEAIDCEESMNLKAMVIIYYLKE